MDANRENEDADKLWLFPALLKKRASGLPPRIARYCRRGPQGSIHDVITGAEKYETTRQTERIRKENVKKKTHRNHDSSSSSEEESSSSSSDSKEEERSHRR
ncbi:hypothetical protein R1flu_000915 [Riccia fluitans]|uniref:Uncharacterized protein n=1 Tax=Riccia fluitans TaxID=41844 RepID=A0ABD1Y1U8_9MARC